MRLYDFTWVYMICVWFVCYFYRTCIWFYMISYYFIWLCIIYIICIWFHVVLYDFICHYWELLHLRGILPGTLFRKTWFQCTKYTILKSNLRGPLWALVGPYEAILGPTGPDGTLTLWAHGPPNLGANRPAPSGGKPKYKIYVFLDVDIRNSFRSHFFICW